MYIKNSLQHSGMKMDSSQVAQVKSSCVTLVKFNFNLSVPIGLSGLVHAKPAELGGCESGPSCYGVRGPHSNKRRWRKVLGSKGSLGPEDQPGKVMK